MDKEDVTQGQFAKTACSDDVGTIPRISSQVLLAGHRVLVIEHNEVEYRLRITSKNKMILTK